MIHWFHRQDEAWEGRFKSRFFRNEDHQKDLLIYIEHSSAAGYAKKCVKSLNSLPESTVTAICEGIVQSAKQGGLNEKWELPALERATDILQYCWFTAVYVNVPDDENNINYIVEGEGEWGEAVGFVIRQNQLAYVGQDYFDAFNHENS